MIGAVEHLPGLGVVSPLVHVNARDVRLATFVHELLYEDVVSTVPIDHMRIRPEPVSGRNDALEPPQGLGEAVAHVVQQNPLVGKEHSAHLPRRASHQVLGQEEDKLPVPRGYVEPARVEGQTVSRAQTTKELRTPYCM